MKIEIIVSALNTREPKGVNNPTVLNLGTFEDFDAASSKISEFLEESKNFKEYEPVLTEALEETIEVNITL